MAFETVAAPVELVDFDAYVLRAAELVKYDDESHQTIGNVPTEERMHIGFIEEWAEMFGDDTSTNSGDLLAYDRVTALYAGRDYTDFFRKQAGGEEQVKLHISEFGDNLWYITNYVSLFGLSLADAMREVDTDFSYQGAYDDDVLTQDEIAVSYYSTGLVDFSERARDLLEHMGSIAKRSLPGLWLDPEYAHSLKQLTRRYIEAMGTVAKETFGIGLDEIMAANIEKLEGRHARQTIFGDGDKR